MGRLVAEVHVSPGMSHPRLVLAAALLPLLSACSAVVPIDVSEQVELQAPAGGDFTVEQAIDLGADAGIWSRRDKIDAISIDEVGAGVVTIRTGHRAATVSLHLALRAEGAPADGSQDLQVGTLADLPFAPDAAVTLPGSAALDAFLLQALHGSGRFTAIATGTLSGPADAVIEVSLKGSATYQVVGS